MIEFLASDEFGNIILNAFMGIFVFGIGCITIFGVIYCAVNLYEDIKEVMK